MQNTSVPTLREVSSVSPPPVRGAAVEATAPRDVPLPAVELRELLRLLWRRRWLIGGAMLVCIGITVLALTQITPRYTAEAQVMVDPRQANVVDIEQVLSGLPANAETIQSEIQVILSRNLAARVVEQLKLVDNPEFNPAGHRGLLSWLPGTDTAETAGTASAAQMRTNRIIDAFLKRLEVRVVGRSRVITISFVSSDPALSALVANTVAELYLTEQLETKFEATRRASAWLSDRLEQLRIDAEAAELAVDRFKAGNAGATRTQTAGAGDERSRQLAADVVLARADVEALRSRLDSLKLLQAQTFQVEAAWPNESLRQMAEQVESLTTQRDDLAKDLRPTHPRVISATAKLEIARHQLAQDLGDVIDDAASELSTAERKQVDLQAKLSQVSNVVTGSSESAVRLHTLEREALASRALFETFLTRFKQTSEQEGLAQADARLISKGAVPVNPSFPDKRLFLLLSVLAGLGLGVVLAFLAEQLDNGFRSATQIESLLGLPTIGHIPSLKSLGVKDITPDAYVVAKPTSIFAESLRMLRTSLVLSNLDQPPRVLAVSSALPGEGKTTTVLALARLAALSGEKVIVVDADLRRPRVHTALSIENTVGLTELLCGRQSLEQVVKRSTLGDAAFDVITSGAITPHATELMRSQQMKALLRRLAGLYALVLVDGPPMLPVADSKVLATITDKVIYVVRWQDTPRETVAYAVKQLREVGADLAGVVLNHVDVCKQSEYGYGDSGSYYGRYRKYYND